MTRIIRNSLRASFTPSVSTRALNTNFIPSATQPVLVSYTVRIHLPLSAEVQAGRVELRSDLQQTPTTNRCQFRLSSDIGGLLTTIEQHQDDTLIYLVPAGDSVRLITTSESGSPQFTIIAQNEIEL